MSSASGILRQADREPLSTDAGTLTPRVSVVVPVLDEAKSLSELCEKISGALEPAGEFEILLVDDGSADDSWKIICSLAQGDSRIHGIRLRRNFGKATALTAGFQRARAPAVMMMDGDLQDDPSDLPKFLAGLESGADVVVGWKVHRLDPCSRRLLSRIFNAVVGVTTGLRLHDANCGFKAFRREVIHTIPIYGDLFRFVPALAASQGFRVTELQVTHHGRRYGQSRYGAERILRGFFDLLSVLFITRYGKRPMHLFGFGGLVMAGAGFVIEAYLSVLWCQGHAIGHRPLLLLGAILMMIGIQLFSLGFLAEFLTYQSTRPLADRAPVREETP